MTLDDLEVLLHARSESEHLEFKEAKTRFDFEEMVGYCAALANEGGGRMVLGVTDKPPRRVVGTQAFAVPERTVAAIFDRLRIKVAWHELRHPQGRVLVLEVPPRPAGQPLHYAGRYLMRAGDQLAPMTPDQLRRIFEEARPDYCVRPARTACGEEEVSALLDLQSYFDLKGRPFPSTRREAIETFAQKGFLQAAGGAHSITNLGALLFAKDLSDFPELSRKAVRVIVYDGTSKARVKDGKDSVEPRGCAAGFAGLIRRICDQLPASEAIAAALRTTTHAYPGKAIRELVGNAIVHQDLTEPGTGVTVEIYDDRIEVTNPGLPILPVDRFIDENQSRNERFAAALRGLGICEERGHGMDEVVAHIELSQLPPYACRLGTRHTTMILSRYKPLKDLTPDERVRAVYQHCCLRFVNNRITSNPSIRERFKIAKQNAATASRLLAEAVAAKKIRPADPHAANKLMRYLPYWA
jgi:ATP-dependent DNA helicase RecG